MLKTSAVRGSRCWAGIRAFAFAVFSAILISGEIARAAAEIVRVHCTPIGARAFGQITAKLREQGIEVKLDSEAGSSAAIAALINDRIDLALTIRPLTGQERSIDPEKRFAERVVAYQSLALIVPVDVWNSGVKAINRDQMALIYEGRTKNWQVLGGEDRPIKFYNPEQGKGLWEPFVTWVYGDLRKAGLGSAFEAVASAEEARNSVEFNGGSISVAPIGLVDSKAIFPLALKDETGNAIAPDMEAIVKQRYPLSRPIVAIASRRPTGSLRKMLDYLQTPEAHEILKQHGLVPAPPDAPLTP